jgi:uncharacterized protein (DUF2267 family)
MLKRIVPRVPAVGAVVSAHSIFAPNTPASRALIAGGDRVAAELRRLADQWEGVRYQLAGRHPDPDVDDNTLADRVRSTIGPVERRLDLPHVHVMVVGGTASLHGEVGTAADAAAIEAATAKVSGVRAVESYLHVGLLRSDSRPSEGRAHEPPSDAMDLLLGAAIGAGVDDEHAGTVVRATLAAFTERLPLGERRQLVQHLPHDVRALLEPVRRHGPPAEDVDTVPELVGRVLVGSGASVPVATGAVHAILTQLRALVPEETADVSAVLPRDLRQFWESAETKSAPAGQPGAAEMEGSQ